MFCVPHKTVNNSIGMKNENDVLITVHCVGKQILIVWVFQLVSPIYWLPYLYGISMLSFHQIIYLVIKNII